MPDLQSQQSGSPQALAEGQQQAEYARQLNARKRTQQQRDQVGKAAVLASVLAMAGQQQPGGQGGGSGSEGILSAGASGQNGSKGGKQTGKQGSDQKTQGQGAEGGGEGSGGQSPEEKGGQEGSGQKDEVGQDGQKKENDKKVDEGAKKATEQSGQGSDPKKEGEGTDKSGQSPADKANASPKQSSASSEDGGSNAGKSNESGDQQKGEGGGSAEEQDAQESKIAQAYQMANQLNEARRKTRGGLKKTARRAYKELGGEEGSKFLSAIDSNMGNVIFAICLLAAIFKDCLDLWGDGMLATVGSVGAAFFGSLTALLSAIPVVGTVVGSLIDVVPMAIGGGAYLAMMLFRFGLTAIIWILLQWRMSAFKGGLKLTIQAYNWLITFIGVLDFFPVIGDAPFETMVVAFGWIMTILLSASDSGDEKESGDKSGSGGQKRSGEPEMSGA